MHPRNAFPVLALAVVSLGFLAGCPDDQVHFRDDLDLVFDFKPFAPARPQADELHVPYVVGAEFRMYAYRDHDRMSLQGAFPESMDPEVLDLWDDHATEDHVDFRCMAVSPGTTEVVVWRNSAAARTWGSAFIEVARPDAVELTFAGPLFIDTSFAEYRVRGSVNVLTGGTATFLVEYADASGRRLYGNNVLEVSSPGTGISAYADQTYLFEDREWLVVTPREAGDHVVDLSVAGRRVGSLLVHAVKADDVAAIELRPESERGHSNGDIIAVLALGYTDEGDPIYGIEYDWEVDGFPKIGEGDLYKYELDRHETARLEANFNGKAQRTTIHSDYFDGWVSSTNHIGCSTSTASGGLVPVVLLLIPLGVLVLRRRRPTP